MFSTKVVFLLPLLATALAGVLQEDIMRALNDVDQDCISRYNETLDSEFLIGNGQTWYEIYQFGLFLNSLPSAICGERAFSRLTDEELQAVKDKYEEEGSVYDLDAEPLKLTMPDSDWITYIVTGHGSVKLYFLEPTSAMSLGTRPFKTVAYKKVNEDYMLAIECELRSNAFWLWGRNRDATVEELQTVIAGISEAFNKDSKRYCAVF